MAAGPALQYVLLDVFTDKPLSGNQLAVFEAGQRRQSDERMQAIARELNLSETVFLDAAAVAGADVRARIFTPAIELQFAGHPTLGSAVVQGRSGRVPQVVIETGAGSVPVELDWTNPEAPFGWMRQPVPSWRDCEFAPAALTALGVTDTLVAPEVLRQGPELVIMVLRSHDELAALAPDQGSLAGLGSYGFYCAARAGDAWEVRMFAPQLGVPEDPATGSGAGLFAAYLLRNGLVAAGDSIEIHQGLRIGRPSLLLARVGGSADAIASVEVGGSAVVVGRGELSV